MPEPLTLADVVSRGTPVDWYEGVAVTQALCDALTRESGVLHPLVPELAHIQLTAEGQVVLPGPAGDGQPPVPGAGRVLLALVPEHQMPVQLRLLALTAVSPTPSYGSVFELSSALDYFARPDRAAQVRAVYEKSLALPAAASDAPPLASLVPPPLPEAAKPAPAKPAPRRKRLAVVGAVAAALGGIAAAGAWAVATGAVVPSPRGEAVVQAVSATARDVGEMASEAARQVGRRVGLSEAPAPAAEGADVPLPAAVRVRPAAAKERAGSLPAALPPVGWVGTVPGTARVDETVFATIRPKDDDVREAGEEPAPDYYAAADVQVTPPALVRPRLPRVPAGVSVASLPHVDMIVSETGEVEWVRLWPADVGVHSAMMLSAIKNWRFEPARKDGRAVRYRQTIALTR